MRRRGGRGPRADHGRGRGVVVLGVHGLGVDLFEHAVQHRLDPAPGGLGNTAIGSRCSGCGAARRRRAGSPRSRRPVRVGIEVTSATPVGPRATRAPEVAAPAGAGLRGGGRDTEDLPVAISVDTGGDHHRDLDHPAALADLSRVGIVSASAARNVYGPAPAGVRGSRGLARRGRGHHRDLGLRQAGDPHVLAGGARHETAGSGPAVSCSGPRRAGGGYGLLTGSPLSMVSDVVSSTRRDVALGRVGAVVLDRPRVVVRGRGLHQGVRGRDGLRRRTRTALSSL